jgi:hypothetical protein
MPKIPSYAAQIASIPGHLCFAICVTIIDGPIEASAEPLDPPPQMESVKPMFHAAIQPLSCYEAHRILAIGKNGELGG